MMYIAFNAVAILVLVRTGPQDDRCELFSRRVHYSDMGLLSRMVEIGPACEGGAAAVRHFSHAPYLRYACDQNVHVKVKKYAVAFA